MGARILAGEREAEIAADIVIDLHEIINRMRGEITELEKLLKLSSETKTEPRKDK